MPSDEIIETMAEGLWQGEWARGGSGGKRRVPWSEIAPVDQERWRFLVIAALSAAEAAGWVMVPKAAEPFNFDAMEAWLQEHHGRVGVTPALRKAWTDYLLARGGEEARP